jgi:hypothetical protein
MVLEQIRADRRKSAVLGVLTVVMIGLYVRWWLSAPADAQAGAPAAAAASPIAAPTLSSGPASATPQSSDGAGAKAAPPASTTESLSPAISIASHARLLERDLFDTDWDAFAPTAESLANASRRATGASAAESLAGLWQSLVSRMAEQQRRQEEMEESLRTETAQLKLQGTLLNPQPKAYLNGQWVAAGAIIGGFEVVRISAGEVELRKSGRMVRLTMP